MANDNVNPTNGINDSFEAKIIEVAQLDAVECALANVPGIDTLTKSQLEIVDNAITAALAIGGYVGAYLFSMGIEPNDDEQRRFVGNFPSINANLRSIMEQPQEQPKLTTEHIGERLTGLTLPSRASSLGLSIGWTILIVAEDGRVILRSDPIAAEMAQARAVVIETLKKHDGGSEIISRIAWRDDPRTMPDAVREVYFAEVDHQVTAESGPPPG